jgi:hypothetical protein
MRTYLSSFAVPSVTGFQDFCCGYVSSFPLQVGLFVRVRHVSVAAEIDTNRKGK